MGEGDRADSPTFGHLEHTLPEDELSALFSALELRPVAFGHQQDNPDARCGRRIIGDTELIVTVGGRGTVTIDGQRCECSAGMLTIIPPFCVHEIETDPAEPHENYFLHLDVTPAYLVDSFLSVLSHPEGPCRPLKPAEPCIRLCRLIEAEYVGAQAGRAARAIALIKLLVLEIARQRRAAAPTVDTGPAPSSRAVLDRSIAFLREHLSRPVAVEKMAHALGMSRSALFSLFSTELGTSPMAYLRWMRLRHAETLLRTSELSVKEIAAEVGFGSAFHFSERFKERYGVSPSHFRAQPLA